MANCPSAVTDPRRGAAVVLLKYWLLGFPEHPEEALSVNADPFPAGGRRFHGLSPAQHCGLDIWQRDAADRLGVARVTGQEILTALIDQLLSESQLSARITRAIQARR
jgi:hypothetical protein